MSSGRGLEQHMVKASSLQGATPLEPPGLFGKNDMSEPTSDAANVMAMLARIDERTRNTQQIVEQNNTYMRSEMNKHVDALNTTADKINSNVTEKLKDYARTDQLVALSSKVADHGRIIWALGGAFGIAIVGAIMAVITKAHGI
jgi:hypothetical protein